MGSGLRGAGRAGLPSGTWPKTHRSFPREGGKDDGKHPARQRKTGPARASLNPQAVRRAPISSARNCEIMTG